MTKGNLKKPKATSGKTIPLTASAAAPKRNFGNEKPTFCLRYVDPGYCITLCDKNDKAAFAERIRQLSTMTWNQIIAADRHGFGREQISRDQLPSPPNNVTEDANFIALRFSGKKPMVGYQHEGTFHIIWFDRDFTLYDHG
jgi:hypothetical protein